MMLRTCSIRDLPADTTAARWAIVRYALGRQRVWRAAGIEWRPGLAPSVELHRWWRAGERNAAEAEGFWGPADEWRAIAAGAKRWSDYREMWATEKAHDDRYRRLVAEAAEVAAARGLWLACWCADEARCHRSPVRRDIEALLAGGAR
ncbi:MAG: hypothetical protein KGK07_15650 [Chloroflexota bacterium]|nr:hypothetical protein [Chloroflexota bacterium]